MSSQTAPQKPIHKPVLLGRVLLECEAVKDISGVFVDCTMGDGGHSYAIYKGFVEDVPNQKLLSLDWDRKSFSFVNSFFEVGPVELTPGKITRSVFSMPWLYAQSNFAKLGDVIDRIKKESGERSLRAKLILFDLGISSRQISQKDRGFSFTGNGKLDMRMDPDTYAITAYDLLNSLSVAKLTTMFLSTVGIKKQMARVLAQEIVSSREKKLFGHDDDVTRINAITSKIVPIRKGAIGRLHPSTLVFLALRIAVNTELYNLYEVLPIARNLLADGGKLLVMTYHSAEEKIVDRFIKEFHVRVKKILPSKNEVLRNPRARSAKLYIMS